MKILYNIYLFFLLILSSSNQLFSQTEEHMSPSVAIVSFNNLKIGTAFVVGDKLLMTAFHVIDGLNLNNIGLTINGTSVDVTITAVTLQGDNSDWVLLKVSGPQSDMLDYVPLKIAGYNPVIGWKVSTYGGVIPDYEEGILNEAPGNFLLTSGIFAAPGDSGSPLLDPAGNVIGVIIAVTINEPDIAILVNITKYDNLLDNFQDIEIVNTFPISNGDFQTKESGDWNEITSWNIFSGINFIPATNAPVISSPRIEILPGHEINTSETMSIDQLEIRHFGTLIVNHPLHVENGTGTDLVNHGEVIVFNGGIDLIGSIFNNSPDGLLGILNSVTINSSSGGQLVNDGIISVNTSSGTTVFNSGFINNGLIKGDGIINFNQAFTNNGTISPGENIGSITLQGQQPFSANSKLQIELLNNSGPGIGNDILFRAGDLTLSGTLEIIENDIILPGTYTIVQLSPGNMITGNFTNTIIPDGYTIMIGTNDIKLIKEVEIEITSLSGSGNSINLDGISNLASIPHSSAINFGTNQPFSIEMWIKIPNTNQPQFNQSVNLILEKVDVDFKTPYSLLYFNHLSDNNGAVGIFRSSDVDGANVVSNRSINDNKFHHLVFQSTGSELRIFIDGILDNTAEDNMVGDCQSIADVNIGRSFDGFFNKMQCEIDELRFWNIALSVDQIRERMCKKIVEDDVIADNLVAYYKMDETSGNTIFDIINNNNGSFSAGVNRLVSGAAIGDESSFNYNNGIKTATLTHPSGDIFTVTTNSSTPKGLQVYKVNEFPNTLNGSVGVGTNNKYFGVFQVDPQSSTYSAVYTYNPSLGIESDFRLNSRDNNSDPSWQSLTSIPPNISNNTITVTGQSTEFILGSIGTPLPLLLVTFEASREGNNSSRLTWSVTQSKNVSHFVLERSIDGRQFEEFGTVIFNGPNYTFDDKNVFEENSTIYYRLKIVDQNLSTSYSKTIKLNKSDSNFEVYPNPTTGQITISGSNRGDKINVTNSSGMTIRTVVATGNKFDLDLSGLEYGIYFVHHNSKDKISIIKILKL